MSHSKDNEAWKKLADFLKQIAPRTLYFPNFLFDFPDKIYLDQTDDESGKHAYYRQIIQDVLDATGENATWERHILERAKNGDAHNRDALEAILLKMGNEIGNRVFQQWELIFRKPMQGKEIRVKCAQDEAGRWYLSFSLREGAELYQISDRSLGFRWFFAFLLLTHYRGFRKSASSSVLFLFDEPASNLHSTAQQQLLESFGELPEHCSVIYSTHSHHLINPVWLENTYVVRNAGMDYDDEENYNARRTQIIAEKYRSFAAQNPNQSSYFQPILDVLDYCPGKLEDVPDVVMVEGKCDFYTLKLFQDKILNREVKLNLLPGGGAGSLTEAIRLYVAWGRNFIILLDSDSAGTKEKQRYEEEFGSLISRRVFTLADVDNSWGKKSLEGIIEKTDRDTIQQWAYPESKKFNKTHFNRAVQELYLSDQSISISGQSASNVETLLNFCQKMIEHHTGS